MPAPAVPPLRVVVAARPDAPGVAALLARAEAEARRGADVRLLFTGPALATPWRAAVPASLPVAACATSARDLGVALPADVLPSSLVAFLRDAATARVWAAFG